MPRCDPRGILHRLRFTDARAESHEKVADLPLSPRLPLNQVFASRDIAAFVLTKSKRLLQWSVPGTRRVIETGHAGSVIAHCQRQSPPCPGITPNVPGHFSASTMIRAPLSPRAGVCAGKRKLAVLRATGGGGALRDDLMLPQNSPSECVRGSFARRVIGVPPE